MQIIGFTFSSMLQTPRNASQSNCNTLTSSYRYRMKCCPNVESIGKILELIFIINQYDNIFDAK